MSPTCQRLGTCQRLLLVIIAGLVATIEGDWHKETVGQVTISFGHLRHPHPESSWTRLNRAEPDRTKLTRAKLSEAGPGRAGPGRVEPSRAESNQARLNRAESSWAGPSRAEPSRAEPSRPRLVDSAKSCGAGYR